jgi:hydroxymethylglutaryl-CoA lyase
MSDLPSSIRINEEGPREGFQFEKASIPTLRKIELINSLSATGLRQIQVVSFVSPSAVPGMADAEEVVHGFTKRPGVSYTGLWLNDRGLERAMATQKLDIKGTIALTASEKFLLRNQKRTLVENLKAQKSIIEMYQRHNVKVVRAGVMAAFGCNFEGDIPVSQTLQIVEQIELLDREHNLGIEILSLADTMAWATPEGVRKVVGTVRERFPQYQVSLHLHDTRGMGIANAYAGLQMGVSSFDAAVGGLGGCPFAEHKGAAGNVCTEDLVFMCHEMGIDTGIDLEALLESARLAEDIVGHPLPGATMRGGSLAKFRRQQVVVH